MQQNPSGAVLQSTLQESSEHRQPPGGSPQLLGDPNTEINLGCAQRLLFLLEFSGVANIVEPRVIAPLAQLISNTQFQFPYPFSSYSYAGLIDVIGPGKYHLP
jgi:hypothetical protein